MSEKRKIQCDLSNVTLSKENGKMIINGCITKIGEKSTGSPCGANGMLVSFTPESVEKCAKTFVGMPLNCTIPEDDWFWGSDLRDLLSGHGDINIGYMRKITPQGDNLMAEMVVWKDKFPEVAELILNGMDALGFSAEWYVTASHAVGDTEYMDEFEGAGCAILWKNTAAFSQTFIEKIAASRGDKMADEKKVEQAEAKVEAEAQADTAVDIQANTEQVIAVEEVKAEDVVEVDANAIDLDATIKAAVEENFSPLMSALEQINATLEKLNERLEKREKAEAEKAEVEETVPVMATVAPKDVPVPKATQTVVANPLNEGVSKEQEMQEIYASKMSMEDKLKAITQKRFA